MGVLLFLLVLRFLAPATSLIKSCSTDFQEKDRVINESGIHLALHHVNGENCFPRQSKPALPLYEILAHDEARVAALNSRLRTNKTSSTSSSSQVSIPLKPGKIIGIGNYYVTVGLGSPVNYYAMLVDTGSSFSWVQCKPCRVYCHPQVGSIFDPLASNTYKQVSCNAVECSAIEQATLNPPACSRSKVCLYDASYGDGSFSIGYVSRDTLTVVAAAGRQERLDGFVYGCGQDNQGLFGRSSGLLGFARNKLSMLSQLSSKYGNAFSYCLPTGTVGSGTLSIGSTSFLNPSLLYKFTPMVSDPRDTTLYVVRLTGISVGGKPLSVSASEYSGRSTIIDSGTVITRLSTPVYEALKGAFMEAFPYSKIHKAPPYGSLLDTCFYQDGSGSNSITSGAVKVPEVTLTFQGGADMKLGPRNVVVEVEKRIACLAFAATDYGVAIIGNTQQQTFSIAYDVANNRIGFAVAACS